MRKSVTWQNLAMNYRNQENEKANVKQNERMRKLKRK